MGTLPEPQASAKPCVCMYIVLITQLINIDHTCQHNKNCEPIRVTGMHEAYLWTLRLLVVAFLAQTQEYIFYKGQKQCAGPGGGGTDRLIV